MAINTSTVLAAIFLTSLFISSVLISFFALNIYGMQLGYIPADKGIPSMEVIAPQDYTSTSKYNTSIMTFTGTWEQSNIGYSLKSVPILNDHATIYYMEIKPDSGNEVTNTYRINNSVKQSYGIIIAYDIKWINNRLIIDNTGFHVPDTQTSFWEQLEGSDNTDIVFIPYPNANQIEDVTISTTYNVDTDVLSFTFNGETFNAGVLNRNMNTIRVFQDVYGGIFSGTVGFTITNFVSSNIITDNGLKSDVLDSAKFGLSMIITIIKTLSFGLPYEIMPFTVQLLLIRTQEICLGLAVYGMIRSG